MSITRLNRSEFAFLRAAVTAEDVSRRTLAATLKVHPTAVSRTIRRLQRRGLIEVERDSSGRFVSIKPTFEFSPVKTGLGYFGESIRVAQSPSG